MNKSLNSIRDELRRLQREGVEHVFVDSNTNELLQQLDDKIQRPQSKESTQTQGSGPITKIEFAGTNKVKSNPVESKTKSFDALPPEVTLPPGDKVHQLKWLEERIKNCTVCNQELGEDAKPVFGDGSISADILFCGDAPGSDDEITGRAFTGEAGDLLSKIIEAMGLSRKDIYATNLLKWRPRHDKPYGNRPPTIEEMNFSLPYLHAQLEIIQPKVIVALGKSVVQALLGEKVAKQFQSIRGKFHEFEGISVMPTFSPAYLLHNGTKKTKRLVWEDLMQVMEMLTLPISEKQRNFFKSNDSRK